MTTTETVLAKCHAPGCGAIFEVPALGICPECHERYIKRLDPTEEGLKDVLASLDNLALELTGASARLDKARDVVAKMLRRVSA